MKTLNTAIAVAFALATILACQEAQEDTATPVAERELLKTVGERIPYETGMRWISRYRQTSPTHGRTEGAPYQISREQLEKVLTSVDELTGVAFHYGLDEAGGQHIMAIPINSSLRLWPSEMTQFIVDANTGQQISREQAFAFAENFEAAHPGEVWFHFFGKEVFDEMKALPNMHTLDLEPALDDNHAPQLLLIVWADEGSAGGRTRAEESTVYDASNACPPCAVE